MRPTTRPLRPVTEAAEQEALWQWVQLEGRRTHPELAWLFHPANGGYRTPAEAARFQRQFVIPGVPDLLLLTPRRCPRCGQIDGQLDVRTRCPGHAGYCGLAIELKRPGGHVTSAQRAWQAWLTSQQYYACVCAGWLHAKAVLLWYLNPTEDGPCTSC